MSTRSNRELLETLGKFHDMGQDHHGIKSSIWVSDILSSDREKLVEGQRKAVDLGRKNMEEVKEMKEVEKVEQNRRVHIVGWFPEGLGIACIALEFSKNAEKLYSHFPLTYFLEGDNVSAGVVLVATRSCLGIPFYKSYACKAYEHHLALDKTYVPILKGWEEEPPNELDLFFANFRLAQDKPTEIGMRCSS